MFVAKHIDKTQAGWQRILIRMDEGEISNINALYDSQDDCRNEVIIINKILGLTLRSKIIPLYQIVF